MQTERRQKNDSMHRLLVITPSAAGDVPTQGYVIAKLLSPADICIGILSRARSSLIRLLDIIIRGLWMIPQSHIVLVDVFGHRAFVYETVVILYARLWQKRIVAFVHNGLMPEFVKKWPGWASLVLSKPDVVLAPHGFLKDQLTALGLRIDGIIPNFIEIQNYRFRQRSTLAPRFLYLRALTPVYNPEMAIRAFALIQRRYPQALLTIGGHMAGQKNEHLDFLRNLASELKIRNLHFMGLVPKEEIPTLADSHDIYLHTNRFDNMPVTIIEMWACGLPIVGTNVGGVPYLVRNGIDGILVQSDDYEAMAEACLELLRNRELATILSRSGRARAEELTWERVKPAWNDVLSLR